MPLVAGSLDARPMRDVVQAFHEQGFGVVPGLFSADEIQGLDIEAQRLLGRSDLIESNNLRCRWQTDVTTGACVFDAFDPVIDISEFCARLAHDPRIQHVLHAIYGEPAKLFKDKLIFKPPGASGYGMHQDYIAWPAFPRSFLTVIVAIDESGPQSGSTEVFPGMHHRGCLTPEDGNYHEIPQGTFDESQGMKLYLKPGDAAIFGAFMPHRSAANRSRDSRRQLYLSYNAASEGGDLRDAHYREFHAWLRDRYSEYGRNETYFL